MPPLLSQPFPVSGTGVLAFEGLLVFVYGVTTWQTAPADVGMGCAITSALLFFCWCQVARLGQLISHRRIAEIAESRIRAALVVGASLSIAALLLALAAGPHGAGFVLWGVLLQIVIVGVARLKLAT
jgi:hypothetical protein